MLRLDSSGCVAAVQYRLSKRRRDSARSSRLATSLCGGLLDGDELLVHHREADVRHLVLEPQPVVDLARTPHLPYGNGSWQRTQLQHKMRRRVGMVGRVRRRRPR